MTKATVVSVPKILWRLFTGFMSASKSIILPLVLVAALALNVATLTSLAAFKLLSTAVGSVAELVTNKPVTVRSKHQAQIGSLDKKLKTEKKYSSALRNQVDAAEKHMATLDKHNAHLKKQLDGKAHVHFKGQPGPLWSSLA